jgi:hypothetical protein
VGKGVRKFENINSIEEDNDKAIYEKLSKDSEQYIFSCNTLIGKNPFFIKLNLCGKEVPALIDTGADVSVINVNFTPKNTKVDKVTMELRSVCGEKLDLLGKTSIKNCYINSKPIIFNPIVVRQEKLKYIILGTDTLKK